MAEKEVTTLMDTDDDVSTLGEEEDDRLTHSDSFLFHQVTSNLDSLSLQDHVTEHEMNLKPQFSEEPQVRFCVVCAHTHLSETGKYVVYSIMIECELFERPALLERRYSDFSTLWNLLQESYPSLTNQIGFPKKAIVGNFTTKLIEERSHSFESVLSYIYSKDILRRSDPFVNFLYRRELQESSHYLLHSQYEDAIPILENIYCLLSRLKGDKNLLLRILLQLIVSLHSVTNYELSYEYCIAALPRFESRFIEGNTTAKDMYVPFLMFCIRLWWVLGKDRSQLERKLEEENKRAENVPELLDLLRDEISLPSLYA